jgi:hypothetical protein
LFIASDSHAFLPPITLPLPERVKISTHIFVGEVRDAYFIDLLGRKISPRQAAQQVNWASAHQSFILPVIETKLRVKESLLWRKVKLQEIVLFRAEVPSIGYYQRKDRANGLARILAIHKKEIGRRYVYLTKAVSYPGRRTYFVYSGGHLSYDREEMREKKAIQKAIRQVESNRKGIAETLKPTAP